MSYKKFEALEEVKKKYVRMALENGNYSSIARSAGVDRSTLARWVKVYEDEVRDQMEDPASAILSTEPSKEELKAKYEQAMKLLGEKELEVAMLRNLLKKTQYRP
ncbi:transposase [Falsibacillus pallidus]|uniref:transposase n=1 Tax=Falsibacillus pallidus TaxID=493781 RepID=UPI003D98F21A